MVGPDYQRPEIKSDLNYTQIDAQKGVEQKVCADLNQWWTMLNDPVLSQLVQDACGSAEDPGSSLTLREMAWRIQQYRAQVGVVRAELFPQIKSDGSYSIAKLPGSRTATETWTLGTSMAWEIDVFGRLKRYTEAAMADLAVQEELYRDAYLLLLSDLATQYITVRACQRQIRIAESNIDIRKNTLALTQELLAVGTSSNLDVSQAKGSLESVQAELYNYRTSLRIALNRLSVLVGHGPGYVDELLQTPGEIPAFPDKIMVGIPAELLRRRPDIRAAEENLIAQNARIGAAEGDLYPIFSLNGVFGLEANSLSDLWTTDSITARATPGFNWNILNFGRYRNNVRVKEFAFQELAATYERTVLEAAEEVDNAISAFVNEKQRVTKLKEAVKSYDMALVYSEERYRRGISDFQRVLDSQREKLTYELLLTSSEAQTVIDVVNLYRALGGGWD